MPNTDFQWALPPAPGQFGAKPPQQQPTAPADPAPYGIGRVKPITPYTPTWQNPALRDRSAGDWGTDDWVYQGMNNYPEGATPEGMHMPTEGDLPGNIHNAVMGLGRYAAPNIAMPMIAAGKYFGSWQQGYQKGQMQAAQFNHQQFLQAASVAAYRLQDLLRKYGDVWAEYGPSDDGKYAGNDERLKEELRRVATAAGDTNVINLLDRGDMGAIHRLMQHLDGQGQDLNKTLKLYQIEEAKTRLQLQKQKAQDAEDALAPYRLSPTAGAQPTPKGKLPPPPTSPQPGEQELQWPSDPVNAGDPNDPSSNQPAAPVAPDDTTPPASAPAAPLNAAPGQTTGEAAGGDQQAAAPAQQPVMVAQADTGTMSDAPTLPPIQQPAAPSASRVAAAQQPAPAAQQAAPAQGPAPPAALPAVPGGSLRSPTLDLAKSKGFDPYQIDQLGQQLSNGTITIQQLQPIPKVIKAYAVARKNEIENGMTRIMLDPKINGKQVLTELDKVNPEFSRTLQGYLAGNFAVPQSAWRNANYLQRVIGLGSKVDPSFTSDNAKIRYSVKHSFAVGQDARNMTSISTLDFHARRMERDLTELKKYDPNILASYIGNLRIGQWMHVPPHVQQLMSQLGVDSETVANEYQRALTGGKPTVAGRNDDMKSLDWRWIGIDNAIASVQQRQAFAHDRMNQLMKNYIAAVGPNVGALGNLYLQYATGSPAQAPLPTDAEKIEGELGGVPPPTQQSINAAIQMLNAREPQAAGPNSGWTIRERQ